jgi:transposase
MACRKRRDGRAYGTFGKKLRWFIVRLSMDYGWSSRAIAQHLSFGTGRRFISYVTVTRILRLFQTTGEVFTPREGTRRRCFPIHRDDWAVLVHFLDAQPDLFLDEMQELIHAQSGTLYSIKTLCRALRAKNYSRRVLRQIANKRDFEEEALWIEAFSQYPADYFVWVDETRKDPRGLLRKRGRGIRGTRTCALSHFSRSSGYSATGIMSLDGMLDYSIEKAAGVNAELFLYMVDHDLLPHLQPYPGTHSVVVLDNASIHHDPRVRQLIESTGARMVFLPPYANNLNPIEEAFSKTKLWLERHRGWASSHPRWALATALMTVNHIDAAGYIRHAGYHVNTIIPGVLYT